MLPIAHRGLWWPHVVMQNSTQALLEAAPYGIETDVRLEFGKLTIRHGPDDPPLSMEVGNHLARLLDALHGCQRIFWNLKSLDAMVPLAEWVDAHDLRAKSVMFDMEMCGIKKAWPEMLGERPLPYLRRASDMSDETLIKALGDPLACGVWLDTFYTRAWIDESTIRTVQAMGKAAYVVSPELHGDLLPLDRWLTWAEADGICTDFPHLLAVLPRTPPNVMELAALLPAGWHDRDQ